MLSYFKSSYDRHDFQVVFTHTCSELQQLMQNFVPRKFMERRNIETSFAKLKLLGSEQTYARSLVGLQAQIEALVMTNNLAKFGMLQTSN